MPAPSASSSSVPSPRSPLAVRLFFWVWVAGLASNIGTWVHEVSASWLMTSLTASPLMVSLIQAANMLPIFVLGLFAGATADIVDRRRLLIVAQAWSTVSAALLAWVTWSGLVTPWLLLILVSSLAVGTAFSIPTYQALVPELVPRPLLKSAIAYNGVSMNLARAIGPALAGVMLSLWGPAASFLLNAFSFVGIIIVLFSWRRRVEPPSLPPEELVPAIITGLRYAGHAPELQKILLRLFLFGVFGAAGWSLLPVTVSQTLGLGPTYFGVAFGSVGLGAVAVVPVLGRLRARYSSDGIIVIASFAFASGMAAQGLLRSYGALLPFLFVAGAAWLSLMSTLNAVVQFALPNWVRARGLSLFSLTFAGSLALGSAMGGTLAQLAGTPVALVVLAACLCATTISARLIPVARAEQLRVDRSLDVPTHELEEHLANRGPVLVQFHYRVPRGNQRAFRAAMRSVRRTRLREGATSWDLYADFADPEVLVESFTLPTWMDHLRQHERITVEDREAQLAVMPLLKNGEAPRIVHFIGFKRRMK